jgi:predicted patatin/cPLA2 family phospholipase
MHPVVRLIKERFDQKSMPQERKDNHRLGLVIEGGGMRGVVSAGMVTALEYLDYLNCFDFIYGSSAGAINGAFFISGQAAFGTTIYYQNINNNKFLNTSLIALVNMMRVEPIMNLDFLLENVMINEKPLDYKRVIESKIPLNVVVSSLNKRQSIVLNSFSSRKELFFALKASASIPIIAGPPLVTDSDQLWDASLYESIPIKSAIKNGCTHILVLRTRPKGQYRAQASWFEKKVVSRLMDKYGKNLSKDFLKRNKQYEYDVNFIDDHEVHYDKNPKIYSIAISKYEVTTNRMEKNMNNLENAAKAGLKAAMEVFGIDKTSITNVLYPYNISPNFIPK